MLRMKKIYLLIAWIITCFLFFEVAAHAQDSNRTATKPTHSCSFFRSSR